MVVVIQTWMIEDLIPPEFSHSIDRPIPQKVSKYQKTLPRLYSLRQATEEGGGGHVVLEVSATADPFLVLCVFTWPGRINS